MSKEQIIEEAMRLSQKDRDEVVELLLLTKPGAFTPEEILRKLNFKGVKFILNVGEIVNNSLVNP